MKSVFNPKQERKNRAITDIQRRAEKAKDELSRSWNMHKPHPFCECGYGYMVQESRINEQIGYALWRLNNEEDI